MWIKCVNVPSHIPLQKSSEDPSHSRSPPDGSLSPLIAFSTFCFVQSGILERRYHWERGTRGVRVMPHVAISDLPPPRLREGWWLIWVWVDHMTNPGQWTVNGSVIAVSRREPCAHAPFCLWLGDVHVQHNGCYIFLWWIETPGQLVMGIYMCKWELNFGYQKPLRLSVLFVTLA